MDRLAGGAVLVRVAPLPELRQRGAPGRLLHHLELEQVDGAPEPHRHVRPPAAARILHDDVEPRRREVRIEDARVVALVCGDGVVRVPLVRDACEERLEQRLHPREVVGFQQVVQAVAVGGLARRILHQAPQQALVQALPDLPVGIAQAIAADAAPVPHALDRQVAGLEQQRLGGHRPHVERGEQFAARQHPVERQGADPAPEQRLHEERRRTALEPVAAELARVEQQQDVERVVHRLRAPPAVAVVPVPDPVPVQPRKLRGEDRVEVRLGVAADGRVAWVEGDVGEVVEAGEHAHLRELADSREKGETDVRVTGLDGRIQPPQVVAVGAGDVGRVEGVQNRLVVLVDQHHHAPAGPCVQRAEQIAEPFGRRVVLHRDPGVLSRGGQLRHRAGAHVPRLAEVSAAEVEPHDGMAQRPVPAVVDVQSREQRLVALEQLLQGVQQQALAEAPRARQEPVLALVQQAGDEAGLVDVVAVLLAQLAEGLQADGESAPVHRSGSG